MNKRQLFKLNNEIINLIYQLYQFLKNKNRIFNVVVIDFKY